MKYFFFFSIVFFSIVNISGQTTNPAFSDSIPTVIDSTYREDQIYIGLTFNFLNNKPDFLSQNGFSGGLSGGVIRDFPINEERNLALALGLGLGIDTYGQNLYIEDTEEGTLFKNLEDEDSYDNNRFSLYTVELPLEFRWRTSTFTSYKFWRIYGGLKASYVYYFQSNYKDNTHEIKESDISELERFRLGAHVTFGYNTFNFQIQYGITPFFDGARLDNGEPFKFSVLKFGLKFYLL